MVLALPLLAHLLEELTLQFPCKLLFFDSLLNLLLALDLRQRPICVDFWFYSYEINVMFAAKILFLDFFIKLFGAISEVRASLFEHVRGPVLPELPHLLRVVVPILSQKLAFVNVLVEQHVFDELVMLLVHFLDQLLELPLRDLGPVRLYMLKVVANVLHSDFHVFLELIYVSSLLEYCGLTEFFFELTVKCLLCVLRRLYRGHLKLIY